MNELLKLNKAINLIALGLYEKEQFKQKNKYYYSKRLMHGINMFQALNLKYTNDMDIFADMHEQAFITKYATIEVASWFKNWDKNIINSLNLKEQAFYYLEALVIDIGFNMYYISESCEDYIQYFEYDIIDSLDQKVVYEYLISLKQEDYIYLRKFFIENPIIDSSAYSKLEKYFIKSDNDSKIINNIYEELKNDYYICPTCGWTAFENETGMCCHSKHCIKKKYTKKDFIHIDLSDSKYRLKRGIMKYIAAPGTLELAIKEYCDNNKLNNKLWPYMDRFDLEITFNDGTKWVIDAKTIREPFFLRQQIRNKGGFPSGNYEKGFYVIPNEIIGERRDYCKIINRELKRMEQKQILCVSFEEIKKEIKKRAESNG